MGSGSGRREEDGAVEREVLPVADEEVTVDVRERETGRVRVRTEVHDEVEHVEVDLERDDVEVTRVPVGKPVDGPVPVREEGETIVVPVLEEVPVVTTQLMLKEELRLTRRSSQRTESHDVKVRRAKPVIERTHPDVDESEENS